MIKKLSLRDFQYMGGAYDVPYFSYRESDLEICIEPCFGGFCVGAYWCGSILFAKKHVDVSIRSEEYPKQMEKLMKTVNSSYQKAFRKIFKNLLT